jgi:autotransporter-associated beta strand protein/surface protein
MTLPRSTPVRDRRIAVGLAIALLVGLVPLTFSQAVAETPPDYFRDPNGVTIRCPGVAVGGTFVLDGVTYTRRTREDIRSDGPTFPAASTSCTTGISDMEEMFLINVNLNNNFNGDISHWDTSSVINMRYAFAGTLLFNQDISYWDTSSVTDMSEMFSSARVFNQPIGGWDTSKVTDMSGMFRSTRGFNQPIGDWDVRQITNFVSMFESSTAFNQDLRTWDVLRFTGAPNSFNRFNTTFQAEFQPLWGQPPVVLTTVGPDELADITIVASGGAARGPTRWDVVDGVIVAFVTPLSINASDIEAALAEGLLEDPARSGLVFAADSLSSAGVGIVLPEGSTLTLEVAEDSTYAGTFSGAGGLVVQGEGALTLTGVHTYTGGTTIGEDAVLVIGEGGTLAPGDVINGGTLVFVQDDADDAVEVANVISGTGSVVQQGLGTLTLTGGNTFTGGTVVEGGTLELGAASTVDPDTGVVSGPAGTGVIEIDAGATLDLGGFSFGNAVKTAGEILSSSPDAVTLSGPIELTGPAVIAVDGDLTLSGGITGAHALTIGGDSIVITAPLDIDGRISLLGSGERDESTTTSVTISGDGSLTATELLIVGFDSVDLAATPAVVTVDVLAVDDVGDVSLTNTKALEIGSITVDGGTVDGISADGAIVITTVTGDLLVTQPVATTSAGATDLRLTAGSASAFGDHLGGDIKVSGAGTVEAPNTVALLSSGTHRESTGLSALADVAIVEANAPTAEPGEVVVLYRAVHPDAVAPGQIDGTPSAMIVDGSVVVTFDAPTDGGVPITGYVVVVTPDGGTPFEVACAASPCTLTGLTNGTSYTVTVAAINSKGTGDASDPSDPVVPATVPGDVTGLTVTSTETTLTAEWTAPTGFGGGTFVRYEVSIRESGGAYGTPVSITTVGTVTTTFTGLTKGTDYEIRVVVVTTANGAELTSAEVTVEAVAADSPSAPTDLVLTVQSSTQVLVAWTAPSGDWGSAVSSYVVTPTCTFVDPLDTSCVISGLTPGSVVSISVAAVNGAGAGATVVGAVTIPGTAGGGGSNGETQTDASSTGPTGSASPTPGRVTRTVPGTNGTDPGSSPDPAGSRPVPPLSGPVPVDNPPLADGAQVEVPATAATADTADTAATAATAPAGGGLRGLLTSGRLLTALGIVAAMILLLPVIRRRRKDEQD